MEARFREFVLFSLYLFSRVSLCKSNFFIFRKPLTYNALKEAEEFFQKSKVDKKYLELIRAFLTEWDNSEDEICYFIESLYRAKNFKELEEFLLKNPEIRDTLLS